MSRLARLKQTSAWRAWKRYGDAHGNVLAAGVGYFAFFSIFPAVALAFSVFGFVLRSHPDLQQSVIDQLNQYLPGFIKDAKHPDGVIAPQAPGASALTITGVIAFVSLVLAGLGWLGAAREGIRAMFGLPAAAGNAVTTKLRDLGVLFTLGLGIGLSGVLTSAVGAAAGAIADLMGMTGRGLILAVAGFVVSVAADTALMLLLLRVLSGVTVPWRELLHGALLGGVGFSLLKLSAAALLPRVTANPLFASIAIVVGLLFWLNVIARLTLISAAWAANDVGEISDRVTRTGTTGRQSTTTDATTAGATTGATAARSSTPAATAMAGTTTARDPSLPTFGARSADRTTLAAGAVIGAAGAVAAGALLRGLRSVLSVGRRSHPVDGPADEHADKTG